MKALRGIALAAVLAATSVAATAQVAGAGTAPRDDLACAAWASFSAGSSEEPEVREGFSYAMNYFLGRYEGVAGESLGRAFTAAIEAATL